MLKLNQIDVKKSSMTSTSFRTERKGTQKLTRDHKESHQIEKEKFKVENLKSMLKVKKDKIERYKQEINRLFQKSNTKETELKKYIVGLNSKVMNTQTQNEDEVEEYYSKIVNLIGNIQEKIKEEINYSKQEMEKEVLYRFMDAEQKQQNLLDEKIEEQKRIIQKMNFTRQEIEKIRVMFQDTNIECDKLTKEKESLRITYQALQDDTISYNRKIKQINKECKELIKENKHLFNEEDFSNMNYLKINDGGSDDDIVKIDDEKSKDSCGK
jgi:hypothetical protein